MSGRSGGSGEVERSARMWAAVSLLAGLGLLVAVVAFLARNGVYVVVGMAGVASSIAGGWWALTGHSFRRDVDGAFLIQVSNNPYILGPSLDVSQRRRLDSGRLGVFAISVSTGAEASQVLTLALAGQEARSGSAFQFECDTFDVRSRSGTAFAGIDGEALELPTPLLFQIHPLGLRLLVPEGNLEEARRRQARDVHVRELLDLARGGPARTRI